MINVVYLLLVMQVNGATTSQLIPQKDMAHCQAKAKSYNNKRTVMTYMSDVYYNAQCVEGVAIK